MPELLRLATIRGKNAIAKECRALIESGFPIFQAVKLHEPPPMKFAVHRPGESPIIQKSIRLPKISMAR
jgi:hypothetical protein